MEIRNLVNQGVPKAEIVRLFGIDKKTVSKYAEAEQYQLYQRVHKLIINSFILYTFIIVMLGGN